SPYRTPAERTVPRLQRCLSPILSRPASLLPDRPSAPQPASCLPAHFPTPAARTRKTHTVTAPPPASAAAPPPAVLPPSHLLRRRLHGPFAPLARQVPPGSSACPFDGPVPAHPPSPPVRSVETRSACIIQG